MDLSILAKNKVSFMTLDEKYLPTAIVLPFDGHARQSKLMHAQVKTNEETYLTLWIQIIKQKINNQARILSIIGAENIENVMKYLIKLDKEHVDYYEALSAKEYFSLYHKGLNRRVEDPINSRLNYGYAVVRSAIARKLVATGFHPTFGIHHDSQLNAFNLDVKKTTAKNHFHIHYVRVEKMDSALLTSAPDGQKFNETQNPSEARIANEGEGVKNFRLADNKPFKEYRSHIYSKDIAPISKMEITTPEVVAEIAPTTESSPTDRAPLTEKETERDVIGKTEVALAQQILLEWYAKNGASFNKELMNDVSQTMV